VAGVSAVVETRDGKVVLIRRSASVAEGEGLWDVPGGHPEPANLGIEAMDGLDPTRFTSAQVRA
jgi:ADP-ribose pyrophosphatase YjhB (NUDIX family)